MPRPGEIIPADGPINCNQGRGTTTVEVENTSKHVVYVTSHYHFFEVNKKLRFDRKSAYGRRLDIPAGSAVGWTPGETKMVSLVEFTGGKRVFGFQGLVNGELSQLKLEEALTRARENGFLNSHEYEV